MVFILFLRGLVTHLLISGAFEPQEHSTLPFRLDFIQCGILDVSSVRSNTSAHSHLPAFFISGLDDKIAS